MKVLALIVFGILAVVYAAPGYHHEHVRIHVPVHYKHIHHYHKEIKKVPYPVVHKEIVEVPKYHEVKVPVPVKVPVHVPVIHKVPVHVPIYVHHEEKQHHNEWAWD